MKRVYPYALQHATGDNPRQIFLRRISPMKILLVNDYATPTGGAEIAILMLREGLRSRGHDARLLSTSAEADGAYNLADYNCFGTISSFRTLLQSANPWAFWQLRRTLAEFQPDVVHVQIFLTQLSPLILPLLRRVPSLYHVVWYRPICPLGTKMFPDGSLCQMPAGQVCYSKGCLPLHDWLPLMMQMKFWRQQLHVFDLIVANSEAVKCRLVAEGIEPETVVGVGVPIRPPRPPLSSAPMVAFAGRLVREKGADLLLRAFARIAAQFPQARLLLVGDGPEREHLKNLIVELGLSCSVAMPGQLPRPELERLFQVAWVQVVPSRWEEPYGLVAAEAMMRGTAVVASNSGGLAEVVQDGKTGILVPPNDLDSLADALLRLLCDRGLAEQMGAAGREIALARFSEAAFVDRFIELYQLLLQNSMNIGNNGERNGRNNSASEPGR